MWPRRRVYTVAIRHCKSCLTFVQVLWLEVCATSRGQRNRAMSGPTFGSSAAVQPEAAISQTQAFNPPLDGTMFGAEAFSVSQDFPWSAFVARGSAQGDVQQLNTTQAPARLQLARADETRQEASATVHAGERGAAVQASTTPGVEGDPEAGQAMQRATAAVLAQGPSPEECFQMEWAFMLRSRPFYDRLEAELHDAYAALRAMPAGAACIIMMRWQLRFHPGEVVYLGPWLLEQVAAWRRRTDWGSARESGA